MIMKPKRDAINSDLKKSASSIARPKLWRLGNRWRLKLQTSAWAQNVQGDQLIAQHEKERNVLNSYIDVFAKGNFNHFNKLLALAPKYYDKNQS